MAARAHSETRGPLTPSHTANEGRHSYTFADGTTYHGDFLDGKRHG